MSEPSFREVELYETLSIVVSHANHLIGNMADMLENDARWQSDEWQEKMKDWINRWMHAHEVLTPGITKGPQP
jgi:hypothetical protein